MTGWEWVYFSQLTCSENHVLLLMAGKYHSVDPLSTARLGHAWAVYTSTPHGSKCYVQIFRGSHVFISLPECFYQIIDDLGGVLLPKILPGGPLAPWRRHTCHLGGPSSYVCVSCVS